MVETHITEETTTPVEWIPEETVPAPLIRTVPYVEIKLEYPDIEPTHFGASFFPAAIPYQTDTEHRIFYWRGQLPSDAPVGQEWTGLCATTHGLVASTHGTTHALTLTGESTGGHELVVDGTIAGDSTTTLVTDYSPPTIELRHLTPDGAEVALPSGVEIVPSGDRYCFTLPSQSVRLPETNRTKSVAPELTIRYPGSRTLYHPAVDSEYVLFPDFGLSLAEFPNPVPVPTDNGELDHEALASSLDVNLAQHPYPVRILWQAFAFTAFDPHADDPPRISHVSSGHLAVQTA